MEVGGSVTLKIRGLDCPDCAAKLEGSLCKLQIVETAAIDFMNQSVTARLIDEVKEKDAVHILMDEILKQEPGLIVSVEKDTKEEDEDATGGVRRKIIEYTCGAALIGLSFFMPSEPLKIAMYMSAYVVFGYEVLIKLVKNLAKGQVFDENFLMGIATIGAIILKEYPEAVGVMLFYNIGEFCQDLAVDKSRRSIKALMGIKPDTANLVTETGVVTIHPDKVPVDSVILIKPGEKVPLDGFIIEGSTQFDTSAITGESVPASAEEGGKVLSGYINVTGLIKVKTTEAYEQSTVMKILEMVSNVSSKKAKTEQFITKFSRYYTPVVVMMAVCLAVIPPVLMEQSLALWFSRALIFLVVSCPCALVLSVPLGYFAGIGACSKKGILVKGGNYLEALTKTGTVVFDKTGTLTKGVFTVTDIIPAEGFDSNRLIETAANIERFSNHPIGKSIAACFNGSFRDEDVSDFEEISGYGLKAKYKGSLCCVGNSFLLKNNGIEVPPYTGMGSVVYAAVDGVYAGLIVVSDEIKDESKNAVKTLKSFGIDIAMLTGDKASAANEVGGLLGIGQVFSQLLPGDKIVRLEEIMESDKRKNPKSTTVFVGDGINDAPSLARADVSVAMGALGQDAAIEASDIVIMNDNPARIGDAMIIAKKTQLIVWQNIVFALSVKGAVLLLGALGFANMWAATFADVGVSLLAVLNSMRNKY